MGNYFHVNRRSFLKKTAAGIAGAVGSGRYYSGQSSPRAAKIVPGKVPELVPGRLDMRWADSAAVREAAALHPFDLQRRMNLAVNAMTACVDPNLGYISYSQVHYATRPAHMLHTVGDFVDDMGRHTDALWMIRGATGTRYNDEVVHRLAENAMNVVSEGVAWNPPQFPFVWGAEKQWPKERWVHLPEMTRVVLGLVSYHRATGDRRAVETVRSLVHGFYRLAEKNDKYLWYPDINYRQVGAAVLPERVALGTAVNAKDPRSGTNTGGNQPAALMGLVVLPALRYFEDTKDSMAAELVNKFARLILDFMPEFATNIGQTHSSLATAVGIYRAGQVFGIPEYKQWAEHVYRHFRDLDFIPDFAWTPENTSRPRKQGQLCCEACTTTDFLELAILLAQDSDENYWDDAERIAMNQLLEGQMLRTDFTDRVPARAVKALPKMDPKWFTTDHVMERSLGGFASFGGPNDWLQQQEAPFTVQCCFGSGARGLYEAWYFAAQEDADRVKVNLHFSKRLPSALVTSYMPGKPVVEVTMTQAKELLVRQPGWASAEETRVLVNGQEQKPRRQGSYLAFGRLPKGALARIEYVDRPTRKTERIGEVEFTTRWRGNAVIEMQPAGEVYPLYQDRGRQDSVVPLPLITTDLIAPF